MPTDDDRPRQERGSAIHRLVLLRLIPTAALFALCGSIVLVPSALADSIRLPGTLRDFRDTHPDFESYGGVDPGIVLPGLGADGKPVFDTRGRHPTVTSRATFDQWYRDVPSINRTQAISLTLDNSITGDPRVYRFDEQAFVQGGPAAGRRRALVLLSDGLVNGATPVDVRLRAERLHAAGVSLWTVGLGAQIDRGLLRAVAGDETRYLEAPEAEALAGLYAGLAERLTCDRGAMWGGR